MNATNSSPSQPDAQKSFAASWRGRFFQSYVWLILKNIIGWVLILLAVVAVPLVPGPAGLPLFLVGFALVNFPGKVRLTARVLRGRPFQISWTLLALACTGSMLIVPGVVLLVFRHWPRWFAGFRSAAISHGTLRVAELYGLLAIIAGFIVLVTPLLLNVSVRLAAKARRRFRPWLRRHHLILLPPAGAAAADLKPGAATRR